MTAAGVFAAGREVRYLRGGRGPTVVLLAPARRAQPLADALRDRFRVIVPQIHRSDLDPQVALGETAPDWLRNFMEGLGVGPSCFVSTPRHLAALLRFASYDGDSVPGVGRMKVHSVRPAPLTELVGREREIDEVAQHLHAGRLLTLTGSGGIGKTRLARAVTDRVRTEFAGGVGWVALGSSSSDDLVAHRVASSLGVSDLPGVSVPELLAREIGDAAFLLVLDDCEHLLEGVAELVGHLLGACSRLTVLATSREALGVSGERAWLVPPLSLPTEASSSPVQLLESDAARLFLARALDADPRFGLDERSAASVAQICRRLDGIPLAIELAAGRVTVLTPAQIAERLSDAFRILSGGARTVLPRHRTLRATIDWSYKILAPAERLLLGRLSVFRGGCTLDAVEAICVDERLPTEGILDHLASLVDRSMVRMQERGGTARYSLLETVRLYAEEKLEQLGPQETGRFRRAYARHFLSLAESPAPRLERLEHAPDILAQFEAEHDNFRGTLVWAVTQQPETALRLAGSLAWFWISTGHWREGAGHLDTALSSAGAEADRFDRAKALSGAGALAFLLHDLLKAEERYGEVTELWRALDEPVETARTLAVLAQIRAESGDPDGARSAIDESLEIARSRGSSWLLAWVLGCRGAVLRSLGRFDEADLAYEGAESASHREETPSIWLLEAPLGRALVAILDGEPERAAVHARTAVRAARTMGQAWFEARALLASAAVAARGGDTDVATVLLGALSRQRVDERPFLLHEERLYQEVSGSARNTLGTARFDELQIEGTALDSVDALEHAEDYLDARLARPPLAVADGSGRSRALPVATPRSTVSAEAVAATPSIRVLALGPLEVYRDGLPLPSDAWRYAKPRELFLFLVCHPRGATREQVGLAFWPAGSTAQIKNNFHVALHRLRKVLGDARWIVLEQDRYRLHPQLDLDFDADRFERGVTTALRALERGADDPATVDRLDDALGLYRGDFLEHEGMGDWHLDLQDSLRRLFVRGQSALAVACLKAGRMEDAAAAFQGIIEADDLREDAYRGLMICRARTGDRTGALRAFKRLESVLLEELDTDPEPETLELAERLRRNESV